MEEQNLPVVKNEKNESKNKIFDYLEKHHTLAIALITAVVAVLNAAMNVLGQIYNKVYFVRWRISSISLTSNQNQIFTISLSILFYALVVVFDSLCLNVFSVYRNKAAIVFLIKQTSKSIRKQCIVGKKECDAQAEILRFLKMVDLPPELKEEVEKLEKSNFDNRSKYIEQQQELGKNIRTVVKMQWVQRLKAIGVGFLTLVLYGAFAFSLAFLMEGSFIGATVMAATVLLTVAGVMALYGVATKIFLWLFVRRSLRVENGEDKVLKKIDDLTQNSGYYWVQNTSKIITKDTFSDQNFLRFFKRVGQLCFVALVLVVALAWGSTDKKEYQIFEYQNAEYAVIYENDGQVVGAIIEHNGVSAQIDTKAQVVINWSNVPYRVIKFQMVEVVK